MTFYVWLPSPNMFLRLIYVVESVTTSFHFMVEWYSIIFMYQFVRSSVAHLGCF